jgi:hypothetical protein
MNSHMSNAINKTSSSVVIDIVGLTAKMLGAHTPKFERTVDIHRKPSYDSGGVVCRPSDSFSTAKGGEKRRQEQTRDADVNERHPTDT